MLKKQCDDQLNFAISTGMGCDEVRLLKNLNNKLTREMDKSKRSHLEKNLNDAKQFWNKLKDEETDSKSETPTKVNINGKITGSPREIANGYIHHIRNKARKIRENLQKYSTNPMFFLVYLLQGSDGP